MDAAYRSLEKDAEKTTKVNTTLRKDLRELQQTQAELEVGRSDFAAHACWGKTSHRTLETRAGRGSSWVGCSHGIAAGRGRPHQDGPNDCSSGGAKERAEKEWTAHRKLENAFLDAYPLYRLPPPVKIREKRAAATARARRLRRSRSKLLSARTWEASDSRGLWHQAERFEGSSSRYRSSRPRGRLNPHSRPHGSHRMGSRTGSTVPELDIYCSEGTAALLPVMLEDCRRHYVRKMLACATATGSSVTQSPSRMLMTMRTCSPYPSARSRADSMKRSYYRLAKSRSGSTAPATSSAPQASSCKTRAAAEFSSPVTFPRSLS